MFLPVQPRSRKAKLILLSLDLMRTVVSFVAGIVLAVPAVASEETTCPNQYLGTAVYFVPKEHADADFGRLGHGFVTLVLQLVDENDIKPTFIAHSAAEFISRYRRLPSKLQQYGIWISIQKGDPYSPKEKAMLEELKLLCAKHRLPLFIHVGREDKDWQRFSCNSLKGSNHAMERTADRFASTF
jgi:hypothetical protein